MPIDRISAVLNNWNDERPELSTEALGIVLRIQAVSKLMADELTEVLSEIDLEWWEYDVLSALRRQGEPFQLSASEITESAMISPGAVTNRIDRLLDKELVTRVEDPEDRRRVLISLTDKGRKVVNNASDARFECADRAVGDLTGKQRSQLDTLLRRLLNSIDPDEV